MCILFNMFHPETIISFKTQAKREAFLTMLKGYHNHHEYYVHSCGLHLKIDRIHRTYGLNPTVPSCIYLYSSLNALHNKQFLLELTNLDERDFSDYIKVKAWIS